jgi:hypothetical protein
MITAVSASPKITKGTAHETERFESKTQRLRPWKLHAADEFFSQMHEGRTVWSAACCLRRTNAARLPSVATLPFPAATADVA